MNEELESIQKNGFRVLVDLPKGRVPITSIWVFETKLDGKIEKLKARLVVRGLEQEGIHYQDRLAPTVKWPIHMTMVM